MITLWIISSATYAQVPGLPDFMPQVPQPSVFTDHTKNTDAFTNKKVPSIPAGIYSIDEQTKERNRRIIEEVDTHIAQQMVRDRFLAKKSKYMLDAGAPDYVKDYFRNAKALLEQMLHIPDEFNLRKAVFLMENAFDPSIKWTDFNNRLNEMETHLKYFLQQEGINNDDALGKNMAIFRFFSDTLSVWHGDKERNIVSYPLLYDFDDFWGRQDFTKTFVTKLINEGSGQCRSMPLLYLILAESLDTEAYLSLIPNHSYVKIRDEKGHLHNIELTNHAFVSDQFIMQSGFVKSEAVRNRSYMQALTREELIAHIIWELGHAFTRAFGYDHFMIECNNTTLKYYPASIAAHQTNEMYYGQLLERIKQEYRRHRIALSDINKDENAEFVYIQVLGAQQEVDRLGWFPMPESMYESWLESVRKEAEKQKNKANTRSLMGRN